MAFLRYNLPLTHSNMTNFLRLTILCILFSFNGLALTPEAHLADEAQEQRARNLFMEVRCLVCEGQVIESSNTEFSFEMRKLIRQKVEAGKSDEEIKDELTQEFGEDILTSVDLSKNNVMLWALPFIFALFLLFHIVRKNTRRNIGVLKNLY